MNRYFIAFCILAVVGVAELILNVIIPLNYIKIRLGIAFISAVTFFVTLCLLFSAIKSL